MIEKIANLLIEKNKRQADLSKFLNIPTSNLSNILQGNGRKFSVEQIALIAHNKGKAIIKTGEYLNLKNYYEQLKQLDLTLKIE